MMSYLELDVFIIALYGVDIVLVNAVDRVESAK